MGPLLLSHGLLTNLLVPPCPPHLYHYEKISLISDKIFRRPGRRTEESKRTKTTDGLRFEDDRH